MRYCYLIYIISIHALREESDKVNPFHSVFTTISIHALREESDLCGLNLKNNSNYFNPRSPRGERLIALSFLSCISTHFNPRSPRGERHKILYKNSKENFIFQSTLSARRATGEAIGLEASELFQSTLSARRATVWRTPTIIKRCPFQSTLSARRATPRARYGYCSIRFQSTLSARRATQLPRLMRRACEISIHALREESDAQ